MRLRGSALGAVCGWYPDPRHGTGQGRGLQPRDDLGLGAAVSGLPAWCTLCLATSCRKPGTSLTLYATDVVTGSSSAGLMGRCLLLPYAWRRRHCWHPAGVRSLLISACCLPGVSGLLCAIPSLLWLLTCRNESLYYMHCLSRSFEGVNLPAALIEERFHFPGEENGGTKCVL